MNIKSIRRENLRMLARELGGVTRLANKLNRSQAQISHLIANKPSKNIGDKLAWHIEQVFDKPIGWLDKEHEAVTNKTSFSVVPLISWQEIDGWLDEVKSHQRINFIKFIPIINALGKKAFALQVSKLNMPWIPNENFKQEIIVIVDPNSSIKNGSFVVEKLTKKTAPLIKQIFIGKDINCLSSLAVGQTKKRVARLVICFGHRVPETHSPDATTI